MPTCEHQHRNIETLVLPTAQPKVLDHFFRAVHLYETAQVANIFEYCMLRDVLASLYTHIIRVPLNV